MFVVARFFEQWFYRAAYSTTAISNRMIERLRERGVAPSRLYFIPTGASLEDFTVEADEDFLRSNGLMGKWIAVYAGTLGRMNGLDYLLHAAEKLKNDEDIRIVIIGEGSEKEHLVNEARRRGLENNPLVFLPAIPKTEVPGVLKACDATLLINANVQIMGILMPNKFFDYLAAGKPIITNVEAEVSQWIRRNNCGAVIKPDEPEELAKTLRCLRDQPELSAKLGKNARRLAETDFDRAQLHRTWEKILMEAAESAHS